MEGPHLKLTVEKGPLEGKTLEKKPGLKIRIGRVVKGNNFVIKDDGISSRHLLIEFNSSNWVVLDLDTSNGTFLNGVQLQPQKPFDLSDGDLIKIGEFTSLTVSLISTQHDAKPPKPTKGPSKKVSFSLEDANEDVNLESKPLPPKPTKAGSKNVEETVADANEVVDLESEVGRGRRYPKRGAAAAKKQAQQEQIPESSSILEDEKQKIRGKSKQEDATISVAENRSRRGRGRPKRGAAASRGEPVESVSEMDVGNNEAAEPSQSAEVSVTEAPEAQKVPVTEVPQAQKKLSSKKEACGESSNIIERMKNMTFGEYLDYLEVYLVKKIYEETDEIIAGMREKAEKFKKFMTEQEKLKNKSPLF